MGMQQKLKKAFNDGVEAGKQEEQLNIYMRGYVTGCHNTWDIVEEILKGTKGVGPKTEKRIMDAIKAFAAKEAERIEQQL